MAPTSRSSATCRPSSCEELWCQGFSEPNAGSDLASLRTRAELIGDEFVVNGQKCWTSHAQIAQWCILMIRTDPAAPKHRGISYLLVDMKSPGVTVKPLRQMHGGHDFNEIFFDNVHVPRKNLLGELHDGWQVSMTTLINERGTSALAVLVRFHQTYQELVEMARTQTRKGRPATEDRTIRQQLARLTSTWRGCGTSASGLSRKSSRAALPGLRVLSPKCCGRNSTSA